MDDTSCQRSSPSCSILGAGQGTSCLGVGGCRVSGCELDWLSGTRRAPLLMARLGVSDIFPVHLLPISKVGNHLSIFT